MRIFYSLLDKVFAVVARNLPQSLVVTHTLDDGIQVKGTAVKSNINDIEVDQERQIVHIRNATFNRVKISGSVILILEHCVLEREPVQDDVAVLVCTGCTSHVADGFEESPTFFWFKSGEIGQIGLLRLLNYIVTIRCLNGVIDIIETIERIEQKANLA